MPHLIGELDRLRSALGPETVAMMQRHEADGTLDHPEYQAAITILNYRHVCRLQDWPEPVKTRSEEHTSELQSLMRISYAVFCLKKKKKNKKSRSDREIQ